MTRTFKFAAAALLLTVSPAAFGLKQGQPAVAVAPARPAALTAAERAQILKDAAKALSSVKTASGKFQQTAPDASQSTGRFAWSKPGKVRFEYDAPTALLIVANGSTVAIQDTELETTERVPLGATPLAFLLDDKIDFTKKAKVTGVTRETGQFTISLADPKGDVDGTLTLFLDAKTKALTGWQTVDGDGARTLVRLSGIETGKKLNPRLFVAKDFDGR